MDTSFFLQWPLASNNRNLLFMFAKYIKNDYPDKLKSKASRT